MAAIIIAKQVINFIVSCNYTVAKFTLIFMLPITRITADDYIFAVGLTCHVLIFSYSLYV